MGQGLRKEDSAALKGAAILMMVFHHCFRTAEKFQGYELIFSPFTQDQVVRLGLLAKICVSIFAFVSGFGLMYGYQKNREKDPPLGDGGWIKRHLISTCSGFWFLAVVSYVLYGLALRDFRYEKWGNDPVKKAVNILLDMAGLSGLFKTKSINGAWWYLSAAILFIVILPLLARLLEACGGLASMLLLLALPRVLGTGYPGGRNPLSFLPAFLMGMICCRYDLLFRFRTYSPLKNKKAGEWLKGTVLGGAALLGALGYAYVDMKSVWEYHYLVVPFLVILFCVGYLFRILPLYRLLQFLGAHSLNIWLLHTFVRDYMRSLVWSVKYFLLSPLVILAISLACSLIIEAIKKKSGYNAWMAGLMKGMK
ncbi:MAG: acyltransferase [Eubacteriales bacterium]|nr:acyltransferase [Eubacteriales bacterium]